MPRMNTASLNGDPWIAAGSDPDAWHATTAERRTDLLNVMPPIYVNGAFAVGEPIRHDDEGRAVYLCVAEVRGQTWVRELARADMDAAVSALRAVA